MHAFMLILPLLSIALFADLTIETQSNEQTEFTYYKAGVMVTVADGVKTIVNTKDSTITIVLEERKIYVHETLKSYASSIIGGDYSHQEQMKMAQEKKEQPKTQIKKTGTADIAGYHCDTYEVINISERTIKQECLCKEVEALIGKEIDLLVLQKLSKEMNGFAEESSEDPLEGMGYSLRTIDMTYGNSGITSAVAAISTRPIKASIFTLPKEYKKVSIELLYSSIPPQ